MDEPELIDRAPERPDDIRAVPVRRPGRWIAAIVVLAVSASMLRFAIEDSAIQWHIVGQYLFNAQVLHGVVACLYLTVLAMVAGVILGVILAVMRLSPNPILKSASWLYIFFFRGTPLLVQIVFWYNIAALFPAPHHLIDIGIPFGPSLIQPNANAIITVFVAALLALGTNEGAYMAEIVRAGIISVPEGQGEAAESLGMGRMQIMQRIVLPQAMRVILPPTGNEFISMLKNTSLASVIGFAEIYYETSNISATNYDVIQLLIVGSIWYLALTSIAYVGQYFLERKVGEGFSRTQRVTLKERWLTLGHGGGDAARI
ncbi:MAG: amino acid ABC transporter permease [Solirubrobacteraceae bacterium]